MKRMLVFILAVIVVCSLLAIPASAMRNFSDDIFQSGRGNGIQWQASLDVDEAVGTGRLVVHKNKSGQVPLNLNVSLAGELLKGSTIVPIYDTAYTSDETVILNASGTINGGISYAYCEYWANGDKLTLLELPR